MTMSAGVQAGGEHLLGVGLEGGAVHGAIEDHRGGQACCSEPGDECGGLPMAPRYGGLQPLSFWTSLPEPSHVGLGPRFVNKDKPFRLQPGLPVTPMPTLVRDVGAFLFRRVRDVFYTDSLGRAAYR